MTKYNYDQLADKLAARAALAGHNQILADFNDGKTVTPEALHAAATYDKDTRDLRSAVKDLRVSLSVDFICAVYSHMKELMSAAEFRQFEEALSTQLCGDKAGVDSLANAVGDHFAKQTP